MSVCIREVTALSGWIMECILLYGNSGVIGTWLAARFTVPAIPSPSIGDLASGTDYRRHCVFCKFHLQPHGDHWSTGIRKNSSLYIRQ